MADAAHHRVLVIGGGNAGISAAARLRRQGVRDVAVIEPRELHRYQPLFSHVAGGTARASSAVRTQASVIPSGVTWIRDEVTAVEPKQSRVVLASGRSIGYDQLVVCPGIRKDWDRIPGLEQSLGTPEVASHYEYDLVPKASRLLRSLRSGTVVFVQPPEPASCAGVSQKPMYLACDYWRAVGALDDIRVVLVVPGENLFDIPEIDGELRRKTEEYGIEVRTSSQLAAVDGEDRIATISGPRPERLAYDVLHVVPPQSAPGFLHGSELSTRGDGFVDVDARTLRHPRFPNVWSLGDAAVTTNTKSGGALRKQTAVVAKNIASALRGEDATAKYDGYSVTPFTVSRSTVVFAEYDHWGKLKPSLPPWRTMWRENRLTWVLDRHVLPWVYWNLILKGLA